MPSQVSVDSFSFSLAAASLTGVFLSSGDPTRQPSALTPPSVSWDSGHYRNTYGLENAKGQRLIFSWEK